MTISHLLSYPQSRDAIASKKMIVPSFAGLNVTTIFNVLEHQRNLHLDTKIQQIKQFSSCLIFPHLTNSIQYLLF